MENTSNKEYTFEKVWQMFQETNLKFQETDRMFQESRKEMERMSIETDKKINKISGMFSSQWGKLMEDIINPACLKLFKSRGIDVRRSYQNVEIKQDKTEAEFDIVLANGDEVVIIEVKTNMTIEKTNHFLEKLSHIKAYFPEYKDKKIYGAVAGIKYSEQSDKYAYRKGLFVLRNSGDYIIEIANSEQFSPKDFG